MNENALFRLKHPSRIYLETTTRCNLKCEMCVKQSSGDGIIEGDFEIDMVSSIDAALPNISSLILNGIGEPLLYPDIEKLILHVTQKMKNDSHQAIRYCSAAPPSSRASRMASMASSPSTPAYQ